MPSKPKRARGFSLIELLVVIAIIALLVSILLPTLAGVRNSAKGAKSLATMNSVQQAVTSFRLDTRALPGLFSQRDLGANENGEAGLTAMENILLDIAAGDAVLGRVSDIDSGRVKLPDGVQLSDLVKVGVDIGEPDLQYYVNPKLFGSGAPRLAVDKGDLIPQTTEIGSVSQYSESTGTLSNTAAPIDAEDSMPDLVDGFGTPLMAWVKDEYGPDEMAGQVYSQARSQFVQVSSDDDPAWFYLNSNIGYLATDALGEKFGDQIRDTSDDRAGSLLGAKSTSGASFDSSNVRDAFMALYGNPSYPNDPTADDPPAMFPTKPLGDVIIQSAGVDGVFFARKDNGAKAELNGRFLYGAAFQNSGEPSRLANAFNDKIVVTD